MDDMRGDVNQHRSGDVVRQAAAPQKTMLTTVPGILWQRAPAAKLPAHRVVPATPHRGAAKARDGGVDATIGSAPTNHPGGPQDCEDHGAKFQDQNWCPAHRKSPAIELQGTV
jgi:hypothetical protein